MHSSKASLGVFVEFANWASTQDESISFPFTFATVACVCWFWGMEYTVSVTFSLWAVDLDCWHEKSSKETKAKVTECLSIRDLILTGNHGKNAKLSA